MDSKDIHMDFKDIRMDSKDIRMDSKDIHMDFKDIRMDCYVINLDRRLDRWKQFIKQDLEGLNIKRVSAIDGKQLNISPLLVKIFGEHLLKEKRGAIAAALTHLRLWRQLIAINNQNSFLILEDDVTLVKNFALNLKQILLKLPSNYDLCFIGYCTINKKELPVVKQISLIPFNQALYYSGAFAYIISKKGMQRFFSFISKNKLNFPIDTLMLHCGRNGFSIFCTSWLLAHSRAHCQNENVDSDIQNCSLPIKTHLNIFILSEDFKKLYKYLNQSEHKILFLDRSVPNPREANIIISCNISKERLLAQQLAQKHNTPYYEINNSDQRLVDQQLVDQRLVDHFMNFLV